MQQGIVLGHEAELLVAQLACRRGRLFRFVRLGTDEPRAAPPHRKPPCKNDIAGRARQPLLIETDVLPRSLFSPRRDRAEVRLRGAAANVW